MGLVARRIEAAGFSTVCLSNVPDLTQSVGMPRLVGIEYPFGRTLGRPGDVEGQIGVLRETLAAAETMDLPGSRVDLAVTWPESKAEARSHPAEPPPIATYLQTRPWQLPRLFARDVPD